MNFKDDIFKLAKAKTLNILGWKGLKGITVLVQVIHTKEIKKNLPLNKNKNDL